MALKVVDPHIHLWDLSTPGHYPWLDTPGNIFTGDYSSIARTHLPADFRRDAGDVEVLKVVHIDAGAADKLRETEWLQALADSPAKMPDAIIPHVDLARDDADAVLARHAAHRNVRGIRQILNVHADPVFDYVGRHFMDEPLWNRNFPLLARHGLSFDMQLYPSQMKRAAEVAKANPEVMIAVNHTGMFADRNSVAGWVEWRDGMRALAASPNVHVKISGMGMIDHSWSVESIRPYVLETIDTFGVDRAMFASNFPVDRLYSTYSALWNAFASIVSDMGAGDHDRLFRSNAERFYRI